MKKIISILLAFLIAMNAFGFYLLFGFLLIDCKLEAFEMVHEIEKGAEDNFLILKFNISSEIEWANKSEIKISGHLYDVVRVKKKSGEIYISCFKDEREDKVSGELNSFNMSNSLNNKTSKNNFPANPEKILKNFLVPVIAFQYPYAGDTGHSAKINLNYHPPLEEILIPPPKYAAA